MKNRRDIFKPTIGNERSHQDSKDNGVTVVNLATPTSPVVNSMM